MNIVVPGINEEYAKILFSEPEEEERLLLAASQSKIVHLSSFTGTRERRLQERIIANLPSSVVVSLAAGALYAPLEFTTLRPVLERCDLLFIYESHLRALLGARPQTALQDLLLEVSRRLADAAGLYPPVIISMQPHTGGTGLRNLIIAQYAKHEWDIYQSGAVLESPRGMVVDSSGSADAIAAAVVYGVLHGCAPSECADFAYVMAMATCSALGGRDGHPNVQELPNVWHRHLPATEVPGWVQTYL
jgi:sugar/nucleoside kinase (ribokinase family)